MRQIEQLLIVRVGVNRGHRAHHDTEVVLNHLRHRRQTIRGARSIRYHVMLRRVIPLVVHPQHDCEIRIGGGAKIITFFTGPRMCFRASSPVVNKPVDSTTISAPTEAQSRAAGSFTRNTLKLLPSTAIVSSVCVTLFGRLPRMESYFSR